MKANFFWLRLGPSGQTRTSPYSKSRLTTHLPNQNSPILLTHTFPNSPSGQSLKMELEYFLVNSVGLLPHCFRKNSVIVQTLDSFQVFSLGYP